MFFWNLAVGQNKLPKKPYWQKETCTHPPVVLKGGSFLTQKEEVDVATKVGALKHWPELLVGQRKPELLDLKISEFD